MGNVIDRFLRFFNSNQIPSLNSNKGNSKPDKNVVKSECNTKEPVNDLHDNSSEVSEEKEKKISSTTEKNVQPVQSLPPEADTENNISKEILVKGKETAPVPEEKIENSSGSIEEKVEETSLTTEWNDQPVQPVLTETNTETNVSEEVLVKDKETAPIPEGRTEKSNESIEEKKEEISLTNEKIDQPVLIETDTGTSISLEIVIKDKETTHIPEEKTEPTSGSSDEKAGGISLTTEKKDQPMQSVLTETCTEINVSNEVLVKDKETSPFFEGKTKKSNESIEEKEEETSLANEKIDQQVLTETDIETNVSVEIPLKDEETAPIPGEKTSGSIEEKEEEMFLIPEKNDQPGQPVLSDTEKILLKHTETASASEETKRESNEPIEEKEEEMSAVAGWNIHPRSVEVNMKKQPTKILDLQPHLEYINFEGINKESVHFIELIQKKAQSFQERVKNYSGTNYSVEHFVIDENLMYLLEELDKVKFQHNETLLREKIKTIKYINSLHAELDKNANIN